MSSEQLVVWDGLDFFVRGPKVQAMAREILRQKRAPVEELTMHFRTGELSIQGKVQKFVALPFRVVIRRLLVADNVVQVPLEDVSAFGFLPVPKLVMQFAPAGAFPEGVSFDPHRLVVTVRLDRFLPPFLEAKVESLAISDGGVRVHIGPGGADLPPEMGRF